MKKRIFSICLVFIMVMSMFTGTKSGIMVKADDDIEYDTEDEDGGTEYHDSESGLNYKIDNNTITITGCDEGIEEVVIPEKIDGKPVTVIGREAFEDNTGIKKVIIPDSITTICKWAFAFCRNLQEVMIPKNVNNIEEQAFYGCYNVVSFNVSNDNKVFSSEDGILFDKDKTKIICYPSTKSDSIYVVPDSVIDIEQYAFNGCNDLEKIVISQNVNSLGNSSFANCFNLEEFAVNENNKYFCSLDGVLFNKDKTKIIKYPRSKRDASYSIPDSVTCIGIDTFSYCDYLQNVKLSKNISDWENGIFNNNAFEGCHGLEQVIIPEGVTRLGAGAFANCSKLTDVILPESMETIEQEAFKGCTSLTQITIPENVYDLGRKVFAGCNSLKQITILNPKVGVYDSFCENTTVIKGYSFSETKEIAERNGYKFEAINEEYTSGDWKYTLVNNRALIIGCLKNNSELVIPEKVDGYTVSEIAYNAFKGCNNIESIIIPKNIIKIGSGAFAECKGLTSVVIHGSSENEGTIICESAFEYCTNLNKLDLSYGITEIEDMAFSRCSSLTELTVPGSVISIGIGAFCVCTSLTDVQLMSGIKYIKGSAFAGCDEITRIVIPDSVVRLESGSMVLDSGEQFISSEKLSEIIVDANNQYYKSEEGVLFNKDGSKMILYPVNKSGASYTVPDGVTDIKGYAFCGCRNLEHIQLPDSLKTIGDRAFAACINLSELDLPENVENMGMGAFQDCIKLDKIDIPKKVNKLSVCIFAGLNGITEVTIPENISEIEYDVFDYCKNLKSIKILNPNCIIIRDYSDMYTICDDDVTIYGYSNSTAQKYAENKDLKFIAIDGNVGGDVNGDGEVNLKDYAVLSRYLSGWDIEINTIVADVNKDGEINLKDYVLIQRYLAGWDVELN